MRIKELEEIALAYDNRTGEIFLMSLVCGAITEHKNITADFDRLAAERKNYVEKMRTVEAIEKIIDDKMGWNQ